MVNFRNTYSEACNMGQVVFVPVSDELLFDHPERIRGRLVPYAPGMNVVPERPDASCDAESALGRAVSSHDDVPARRAHR